MFACRQPPQKSSEGTHTDHVTVPNYTPTTRICIFSLSETLLSRFWTNQFFVEKFCLSEITHITPSTFPMFVQNTSLFIQLTKYFTDTPQIIIYIAKTTISTPTNPSTHFPKKTYLLSANLHHIPWPVPKHQYKQITRIISSASAICHTI